MSHRPIINTEVLRQDREAKGLSPADVAATAGMSEFNYTLMEEGEGNYPTQNQLRSIADLLSRPIWFYFLEDLPEEEPRPRPSLRFRSESRPATDLKVYKALKEADQFRDIAIEAADDLVEIPTLSAFSTTASDPEEVAAQVRRRLGAADDIESEDPYNFWRSAIESTGVLVFHFSVSAFSGFAQYYSILPIIGISTKESRTARLFTLAHELAHIVLRDSTVHAANTDWFDFQSETERWCNRFAAALILPRSIVRVNRTDVLLSARELSQRYGLSPEAAVWRMQDLSLIDRPHATGLIAALRSSVDEERQPKEKGKGPYYYDIQLAKLGYLLPGLLDRATNSGSLSEVDVVPALRMNGDTYRRMMEKHSHRFIKS